MEGYKFNVGKSELELLIKALKIGAIYSSDRFEKAKYRYLLGEFESMLYPTEEEKVADMCGVPELASKIEIKKVKPVKIVAVEEAAEKKK